jgi:hypothetical protein
VSLSVAQWSKSAGEQVVLCTVITRMYVDHIKIILKMGIYFIILLYTPVSLYYVLSFIRLLVLCRTKPLLVMFA